MSAFVGRQGIKLFDRLTDHDVLRRFDELIQTQWLSADELRALQLRRLQSVLEYAYEHVPYYKRVFDQVGFRPEELEEKPDGFQKIPPVSKAYMRDHIEEFLTTDPAKRDGMTRDSTSGSTGEPFAFWEDRYNQSYAIANTFRHHAWCGWQLGQPRAYLWSAYVHPGFKQTLREAARNFTWNVIYANGYNLSTETMSDLARRIRRRRPRLLHGYPSALHTFAQFLRDRGWDDVKVPSIYCASEVLYPHQREYIEETFDCQVFNRYAAQEVSGIACECEAHGGMHISTETNYVEILDEDNVPVGDGEAGSVVVTSLTNYVCPFVRYRLEDRARMSTAQCTCGRNQPMLEAIEGRNNDMFKARDGRRVLWGIARSLKGIEGVRRYQFIQKTLDYVVVRVVREAPLTEAQRATVQESVRFYLGDHVEVDFEFPDEIPASRSGKYRYMICEVD
jgi:phenylacetate-CoA ligase